LDDILKKFVVKKNESKEIKDKEIKDKEIKVENEQESLSDDENFIDDSIEYQLNEKGEIITDNLIDEIDELDDGEHGQMSQNRKKRIKKSNRNRMRKHVFQGPDGYGDLELSENHGIVQIVGEKDIEIPKRALPPIAKSVVHHNQYKKKKYEPKESEIEDIMNDYEDEETSEEKLYKPKDKVKMHDFLPFSQTEKNFSPQDYLNIANNYIQTHYQYENNETIRNCKDIRDILLSLLDTEVDEKINIVDVLTVLENIISPTDQKDL